MLKLMSEMRDTIIDLKRRIKYLENEIPCREEPPIGEKESPIRELKKELKKDPDYYYVWQANIAMAFFDEYRRIEKEHKSLKDIHSIANEAAKNFLDLLIK